MIRNIIIVAVYLLNYGYDESGAIPLTMRGGNASNIKFYNYLVSVHIEAPGRTDLCGGCIISQTYAITAAHCVAGYEPENVRVRIGSSYMMKEGQYLKITRININNDTYNSETKKHDVGSLHLQNPLTFKETVGNIYYPGADDEFGYAVGTTVKVLGFGWREGGTMAIQIATMKIVNNTECEGFTADFDHRFCVQNGNIEFRKYDEGGPVVYGNMLIGIVSLTRADIPDRCVIEKVPDDR